MTILRAFLALVACHPVDGRPDPIADTTRVSPLTDTTAPPTDSPSTDPTEATTLVISEQYWDAAKACWRTRELVRPSSAWPVPCDMTLDTGARWAFDLISDADGNCVRLPVHCDQTDPFFGPCAAVVDCCDEAKLSEPNCP